MSTPMPIAYLGYGSDILTEFSQCSPTPNSFAQTGEQADSIYYCSRPFPYTNSYGCAFQVKRMCGQEL